MARYKLAKVPKSDAPDPVEMGMSLSHSGGNTDIFMDGILVGTFQGEGRFYRTRLSAVDINRLKAKGIQFTADGRISVKI